ncbi:MAG TPA: hypothetical protein PLS53_17275 [Thermoanaerobaculaceae bacterium]|nr:hypothetical protein [Thermoanaerobaculaceae bacterium]
MVVSEPSTKWVIRDGDREYVADSWPTLVQWVRERRISATAWVLDPRTNQWLSRTQIEAMAGPAPVAARSATAKHPRTPWLLLLILLGALSVAGVLVLLTSSGSSTSSEPSSHTQSSASNEPRGNRLTNGLGRMVPVATSSEALDEMLSAGTDRGIAAVVIGGRGFLVSDGTQVSVVGREFGRKKILVTAGEMTGRTGWVVSEWVK